MTMVNTIATVVRSTSSSSWQIRQWNRAYIALLLLRIYFAFQPGYIYPDEYDRGKGLLLGRFRRFGIYAGPLATCNGIPCHSLYPSGLSSQLLLVVVNYWNWTESADLNPYALFVAERVSLVLFSLSLDYTVLSLIPDPKSRARALVLLSSSYMMLTYQVRQYSTSLEAVMVALALGALHVRTEQGKLSLTTLIVRVIFFTIYCTTGAFTEPSFLAFALPVIYDVTAWSLRDLRQATSGKLRRKYWTKWIQFMAAPAIAGLVHTFFIVSADTVLWWEETNHKLTIIPFNWFTLWQHPLISVLWVLGPGLLFYGICAAMEIIRPAPPSVALPLDPDDINIEEENTSRISYHAASSARLILHAIIGAVVFLLIFWHQEPRVFTPLLAPCILIVGVTSQIQRMGRAFWISWISANAVLAVIFGVFHQGGVIPSLIKLHDYLGHINSTAPPDFNGTLASVTYWKTFPPQWHMLALSVEDVASGRFNLTYLEGALSNQVIEHVLATNAEESLVVAPFYAVQDIAEEEWTCFELRDRIFPHLDSDHVSEVSALGWKDGLSLGIFTVDTSCLEDVATKNAGVGDMSME